VNNRRLFDVFNKLEVAAKESDVKVVIMGGLAVSIYAQPRATLDIDGIIELDERYIDNFLTSAEKRGFSWDKEIPIKRIKGLSFITLYYPDGKVYVDLFLAKGDFQENVIRRSHAVNVEGVKLDLISPEDLILVKLISDRPKDTEDVRQILLESSGDLDFKYLEKWAGKLGVLQFLRDEMRSLKDRISH
jgi:predicted nucleotidyltransferase